MKKLIAISVAVLFFLASALSAKPPHPSPTHFPHHFPNKPHPHPVPHHLKPHPTGPKHNLGKTFKGKTYKHWLFHKDWMGWSRMHWYPVLGVWLYWFDGCWYQYIEPEEIYVPLDELCGVDFDEEPEVVPAPVPVPVPVPPL